jgi:hypothetical protein
MKEAVLLAFELEGEDGRGKDGLVGFFRQASRTHKGNMLTLAGRILPYQINATVQGELTVTEKFKGRDLKSMTLEEKQAAMREMLNLTKPMRKALPAPNQIVDGEFEEVEADEKSEAE